MTVFKKYIFLNNNQNIIIINIYLLFGHGAPVIAIIHLQIGPPSLQGLSEVNPNPGL